MKPLVQINLTHRVADNAKGQTVSIYAAFEGKLPTNLVPDIGHSLWLDIWEDGHPYEIKVAAVNHELCGNALTQKVVLNADLGCPDEAPEDGSIESLIQFEMDNIETDIAPRLLRQGFAMTVKPNTDGITKTRKAEKPMRQKKVKLPAGCIDCTKKPFVQEGFTIITHDTTLGQLKWNREEFSNCLYLPPRQRNGGDRFIHVCEIHGELLAYDAELLNGNVLDFLVENPDQIPTAWQGHGFVHFFGTIIANQHDKYVPTLKELGCNKWGKTLVSLKQGFNGIHVPTAVTPKFIKMELEKYPCNCWGLRGW